MTAEIPKMYDEIAPWWHLLSAPADYLEEATFFRGTLGQWSQISPRTLLELGSGGGNNASHLKGHFQMTLVDRSPAMLSMSRALNPECEHIEGDMRTVRLGRLFDAVFIHDAIEYMTTVADLEQSMRTAYVHCRAGGAALFVPDQVRESFKASTEHGGHDGDGRSMRYLEWTHEPAENDTTYAVDYAYLLREGDGAVKVVHDRHICGVYPRAEWLRLLDEIGFEPRVIVDPYGRDVFVGMKPR